MPVTRKGRKEFKTHVKLYETKSCKYMSNVLYYCRGDIACLMENIAIVHLDAMDLLAGKRLQKLILEN